MKIPYNRLHVCGDVVFAARGGKLHSFSLKDGSHIATWQHPDVAKVAEAVAAAEGQAAKEDVSMTEPAVSQGTSADEPPAKRQKVAEATDDASKESSAAPDVVDQSAGPAEEKGKSKKGKKKQEARVQPTVPDRPVITHLTGTADGSHIVAVSGHDKSIWVFTHDGAGSLTQFSQR